MSSQSTGQENPPQSADSEMVADDPVGGITREYVIEKRKKSIVSTMTAQEMSGSTLHLFRQWSPSPSLGALRSRLSHEASCAVRSSERDISIPRSASPALPYCRLGLRRCFLLPLFSNIWSAPPRSRTLSASCAPRRSANYVKVERDVQSAE